MSATITASHGATDISDKNNNHNTEDTAVNAGFSGSKSGQRKKPFKINNQGSSSLDYILDCSAKFTAPLISQPTTLTEIVGCSNRPAK